MDNTRKLQILESIATVAQDSAESGNLDQSTYADVFELISDALHSLTTEGGATA
ncbi:MAG: hypothetical protein PHS82_02975 [Lachnospiraceae bacterium]|nr:hypothetical protein [Lachnospiraceae bacterium]